MSDRDDYPSTRTGPGRRSDDSVHMWQRVISNPVSVITLCITAVVTVVTMFQRANNALPRDEFNDWKLRDSIVKYYDARQGDAQYQSLTEQIADLKTVVVSLRLHDDTLTRLVRRYICVHNDGNAICQ